MFGSTLSRHFHERVYVRTVQVPNIRTYGFEGTSSFGGSDGVGESGKGRAILKHKASMYEGVLCLALKTLTVALISETVLVGCTLTVPRCIPVNETSNKVGQAKLAQGQDEATP